jgi:hypothetical protein
VLDGTLDRLARKRNGFDASRRELLRRAAASARHERPLRIRHAHSEVIQVRDGVWLVNDELIADDTWPRGQLRHAGARGRVLRVS